MDTTRYGDHPLEDRMAALEARVRMLEDQLAVQQLLNRWGPAVDTGDSTAAAALWTDDGVLESEISYLDGPAGVAAMVESDGQQALIRQGCAHVQAFPLITVDGDRATATGYSRVYLHQDDGSYEVWRVSANRWEFARTTGGWRATRRTNHVIDGGTTARDLLRGGLAGSPS
jgi:ketosteroid isomerase-like protein